MNGGELDEPTRAALARVLAARAAAGDDAGQRTRAGTGAAPDGGGPSAPSRVPPGALDVGPVGRGGAPRSRQGGMLALLALGAAALGTVGGVLTLMRASGPERPVVVTTAPTRTVTVGHRPTAAPGSAPAATGQPSERLSGSGRAVTRHSSSTSRRASGSRPATAAGSSRRASRSPTAAIGTPSAGPSSALPPLGPRGTATVPAAGAPAGTVAAGGASAGVVLNDVAVAAWIWAAPS
ncbi:MAG TPA: hypothetical protein VI248_26335 [Kineosporiaceae bacterium]